MPSWGAQAAGAYTVQVTTHDKAGNAFTPASGTSFTLQDSSSGTGGTGADDASGGVR